MSGRCAAIGKLLLWLRTRGLYDDTMIVVTSDHGERSLIGHGGLSVYQDQVSVPLPIKYPGKAQGGETQVAASHVDILPTILRVARIETPPGLHGRSLLETATERQLVSESFPGAFYLPLGKHFNRIERAIIEGNKKLIVSTLGKVALYDLASDPEESRNLFQESAPEAIVLRAHLAAWLKATPPSRGGGAKPSKETLDNLKSLGYVQ